MFAPIRLFQNRSWLDESPLTSKLRKQNEDGREGRMEQERGIISDSETEFVMEVFLSFMLSEEESM